MQHLIPLTIIATSVVTDAQIACIQVVSTTIPYQPAFAAHTTDTAAVCPTSFYQLDSNAGLCCARTATPQTSGTEVACCPCGAVCTGELAAVQTWGTGSVGATGIGPVTITQVSSGGASASTFVETYSPAVSSGPGPAQTTATNVPSTVVVTSSGQSTASGTATTHSTTTTAAASTTSSAAPQSSSAAEAEALLPATFISGAFVVLVAVRALFV